MTTATDLTDSPRRRTVLPHPLWRRILLTREAAIIALLRHRRRRLRRLTVPQLRQPAHPHLPAPRHRADPADRAADDAHHHHRGDRPLGGQHPRPGERRHRRSCVQARLADAGCRRSSPSSSARSAGAFNGFLVTVVGLPSLAVTIGTLALFRGIAVGLLGTTAVTDFPELLDRPRAGEHPRHVDPGDHHPVPRARDHLRGAAALHPVRPLALRDRPQQGGGRASPASTSAAPSSSLFVAERRGLRLRRASTSRCATAAPAATTPSAWSSRSSPRSLLGGVSIFGGRGALHGVIAGVLLIGALVQRAAPGGTSRATSSTSSPACCSSCRWSPQASSAGSGPSGVAAIGRTKGPARRRRRRSLNSDAKTTGPTTAPRKETAMFIKGRKTGRFAPRPRRDCRIRGTRAGRLLGPGHRAVQLTPAATSGGGDAGGSVSVTFLPKNLGNPYFDTSNAGGAEAVEEFGGTFEEVGPTEASPTAQVPLHPDRGPAGRRRARRLRQRSRGHL